MKTKSTAFVLAGLAALVAVGTVGAFAGLSFGDSNTEELHPVAFDQGEPIELDPADATISGAVDVEPGTELTVGLMTVPGEQRPFFVTERTTVGEDGEFEVGFDFSNITAEPGTEATVTLTIDGESEELGTSEVLIVE